MIPEQVWDADDIPETRPVPRPARRARPCPWPGPTPSTSSSAARCRRPRLRRPPQTARRYLEEQDRLRPGHLAVRPPAAGHARRARCCASKSSPPPWSTGAPTAGQHSERSRRATHARHPRRRPADLPGLPRAAGSGSPSIGWSPVAGKSETSAWMWSGGRPRPRCDARPDRWASAALHVKVGRQCP